MDFDRDKRADRDRPSLVAGPRAQRSQEVGSTSNRREAVANSGEAVRRLRSIQGVLTPVRPSVAVVQRDFDLERIKNFVEELKKSKEGRVLGRLKQKPDFVRVMDTISDDPAKRTKFWAYYKPEEVVMDETYRYKDPESSSPPPFYASDVFFHQYATAHKYTKPDVGVSRATVEDIKLEDIPLEPPKLITRSQILNEGTRRAIEALYSPAVDYQERVFDKEAELEKLLATDNGKHTKNIVDAFNDLNKQRDKVR